MGEDWLEAFLLEPGEESPADRENETGGGDLKEGDDGDADGNAEAWERVGEEGEAGKLP